MKTVARFRKLAGAGHASLYPRICGTAGHHKNRKLSFSRVGESVRSRAGTLDKKIDNLAPKIEIWYCFSERPIKPTTHFS
jgi:hypothetical protein